jgi:GNAT superfamily N-acetyltransferase
MESSSDSAFSAASLSDVEDTLAAEERAADGAGAADAAAAAAARVGELLRLCVLPALRRCGVAAALTGHVERWARSAHYTRMRLTTQTDMVAAQRLYARLGYADVSPPGGVTKSYHGDLITLIDYEKALAGDDGGDEGREAGGEGRRQ